MLHNNFEYSVNIHSLVFFFSFFLLILLIKFNIGKKVVYRLFSTNFFYRTFIILFSVLIIFSFTDLVFDIFDKNTWEFISHIGDNSNLNEGTTHQGNSHESSSHQGTTHQGSSHQGTTHGGSSDESNITMHNISFANDSRQILLMDKNNKLEVSNITFGLNSKQVVCSGENSVNKVESILKMDKAEAIQNKINQSHQTWQEYIAELGKLKEKVSDSTARHADDSESIKNKFTKNLVTTSVCTSTSTATAESVAGGISLGIQAAKYIAGFPVVVVSTVLIYLSTQTIAHGIFKAFYNINSKNNQFVDYNCNLYNLNDFPLNILPEIYVLLTCCCIFMFIIFNIYISNYLINKKYIRYINKDNKFTNYLYFVLNKSLLLLSNKNKIYLNFILAALLITLIFCSIFLNIVISNLSLNMFPPILLNISHLIIFCIIIIFIIFAIIIIKHMFNNNTFNRKSNFILVVCYNILFIFLFLCNFLLFIIII